MTGTRPPATTGKATRAMGNLESLALTYRDGQLLVLDQRLLPQRQSWVRCESPEAMCQIIGTLQVRGAPLIGIAAALALADYAGGGAAPADIVAAATRLAASRPTAVNLQLAMDRMVFKAADLGAAALAAKAEALFDEDRELCRRMGELGASLIADGDHLLTHCNTGSLVTTGIGTALGAIKTAWRQGKKIHVYVDETRPLLQGARLTAWELAQSGIPHTLICDAMAASLMAQGKVDKVLLGADRIAVNGDVANKIGTYSLAVLANHHRLPFYVVAPYTTVDFGCRDGADIPIEERSADEVRGFASVNDGSDPSCWAPPDTPAWNPAFDVTPAQLVTALVLDQGIFPRDVLQAGGLKKLAAGLSYYT